MKTNTLTWVISMLLLLPNICKAQDIHQQLENFFSNHSLRIFETDLGLTPNDYKHLNRVDRIDDNYNVFFHSVHDRLERGDSLSQSDLQIEYDALVGSTKTELKQMPDQPFMGSPKLLDGPCVNMDFETGDLTGWDLTRGNVDGSAPYSFVNEFVVGPGPYHQIFGGGVDPITGVPRVNPLNGNFSVRLGNGVGVGARAARMKQTFLVDATNYMFTYSYAVIFESPAGHGLNQLPYFTVRVFDEFGNNAPCGDYSVIADAVNAPNFQTIISGGETVLYQDWQTVFANLSGYIGQNVTIEFTTGDCSLTGHYGYAYVDASCGTSQLIASQNTICTGEATILTAPAGAAGYLWSTGATSQSISVTAGGTYTCTLTPTQGGACSIDLDITIAEYPTPTADFSGLTEICEGETITFTDLSTIPAPGSIVNYRWDFGDGIITPIGNGAIGAVPQTTGTYQLANHTFTTAGVYNVELWVQSADGCEDSITIPITVNALPVVDAGPDQTVCDGVAVTLNGAGAVNYAWDNGVTDGLSFVQAVGTVTYTVTGTDGNGCSNTDQVDVTVNPLPIVDAGPDQTLCDGDMTALNGAGALNYAWDNGVVDGIQFTPPLGTLTYTVIGTDGNGCSNTDQVDITVNPLPNVNAGLDQTVCEGTSVTLNGSGASVYVWDNGVTNGVSFIPPVGTQTYSVEGTDLNGCINTDQVDVTVNPLPIVNAGPDQTVCDGVAVTLNGAGAVNYAWDNGVTDGVSFVQAVGTVTYTVTGIDGNACSNTDQVDVTVNPLPIVDAGADQTICDGASVTLNGAGALNYAWDNGVVDGVQFTPPVGTLTYTVIGTDGNGCSNTDQVDVTVNPLPNVNAGLDQTVCEGTAVTLNGAGANVYVWDNGVVDGVSFVPPVGTQTYSVEGTDVNGCLNNDQVDITVNPLPNVNAGPDQAVCDGVAVTLNGAGALNYVWNNGVTNGVSFIQIVGTITYTVTGTDANGCVNTDQVDVTVNPLPEVDAGSDQAVCDGTPITLFAAGTQNLNWNNGVINGVPFNQGVVTVTYTVFDSFATGCSASDQVTVTVNPNPNVRADDVIICAGDGAILSGEGADFYSWSDGVVDGVEFFPTVSGMYTVTGTNNFGCTSTGTAMVTVLELPIADFNILDFNLTTVTPGTGFDNLSSGAVAYEWNFGDGSGISNEFEPYHEFPSAGPGSYEIVLTAFSADGCMDERVKYVYVTQDYTIYVPNAFTPDANGVNETFKPVLEGFEEDDYTLYIFNRWGELVFESHDMNVGWDGKYSQLKEKVQDGVFTWKIEAGIKNSSDSKIFVGHVSILK
ncbi:MAG: PKD domain-containing protein [Crocinitomicaceae bacterium]|nr:PKD domain-containing protein [Crocinitomicaceae bacterium]